TTDRDLAFGHGLEQGRLDACRRPVDLIDEDDIGKDRAGFDGERLPRRPEDPGPDDVRRDQIRRELDAVERPAEDPGQRREEHGLAETRSSLEEHMAVREDCDEESVHHPVLPDDDAAQLMADLGETCGRKVDAHRQAPRLPLPLPCPGAAGAGIASGPSCPKSSSRSWRITRSIEAAAWSSSPFGFAGSFGTVAACSCVGASIMS